MLSSKSQFQAGMQEGLSFSTARAYLTSRTSVSPNPKFLRRELPGGCRGFAGAFLLGGILLAVSLRVGDEGRELEQELGAIWVGSPQIGVERPGLELGG